jgi:putative transposase
VDEQQRQDVALFRFRVIAPLLEPELTAEERRRLVADILSRPHSLIDREEARAVSERTLRRWLAAWRRQQHLEDLMPRPRRDAGSLRAFGPEVLDRAAALRRELPQRSTERLIELLTDPALTADPVPAERVRRSTLARHLARAGLTRRALATAPGAFRRFEKERPNLLWIGDGLDGPYLPDPRDGARKRQSHLLAWIDDHSRFITAALWTWAEDLLSVLRSLRQALVRCGLPARVYIDRGAAYHARQFELICARLGIRTTYGKPGRKEGRGKIERFWGHVNSSFLPELRLHPAATLNELQALFDPWLVHYHQRVHSETGEAPAVRWERHRPVIRLPDPIALGEAFLFSRWVHVDKTAIARLHGNRYEVAAVLAGQGKVELRYDPLDLSQVRVFFQGCRYPDARPVQLHRQTDPDIQIPPEPVTAPVVSDYLGALQEAYRQSRRQQLRGLRFAQRLLTPPGEEKGGETRV